MASLPCTPPARSTGPRLRGSQTLPTGGAVNPSLEEARARQTHTLRVCSQAHLVAPPAFGGIGGHRPLA